MTITVVGLNYKSAPVAVRERVAFHGDQVPAVLGQLKTKYPEAGFVLLSTCNRTELYYAAPVGKDPTPEEVRAFLGEFCSVSAEELERFLYVRQEQQAVRHLLTVAASLDSLVIGESQILAQVKESYSAATAAQCTNKILNRLFHCAFTTSKEVYTLTSIAQRRVSVAGVAVELACQLFADIRSAQIIVIGAGEMGELLIRHLQELGCEHITVFNRTLSRAEKMARDYHVAHRPWEDLKAAVQEGDIVVAAVLTEQYLFDRSFLSPRHKSSLLIMDIAVPRNFDPAVNELENVYLYSVDDLEQVVQQNVAIRQEDIDQAREIIDDNVESFMDWFGVMDIGPLIGRLRDECRRISQKEFERFVAGESELGPLPKQKMEAAVNRIVNKLLHRIINASYHMAKAYGPAEATHLIESIIEFQDRAEDSGTAQANDSEVGGDS